MAAKTAKKPKEPKARPAGVTPERLRHAGGDVRVGADMITRVEDEPLKRLYNRNVLDRHDANRNRILYEAGERYFQYWYRSGLGGIGAIDYGGSSRGEAGKLPPSHMPSSETVAHHRAQFRVAQAELGTYFTRIADPIILGQEDPADVGCRVSGQRDPNRGRVIAIDRLVEALVRLAKMWGMLA